MKIKAAGFKINKAKWEVSQNTHELSEKEPSGNTIRCGTVACGSDSRTQGGEGQDFLESGASLAYTVSLDSLDYGVSSSLKNQETKFKSLIVSNYNSFKNI